MITIFTTLKPITSSTKIAQVNAISSWKALGKDIEIIVFGSDKGVSTLCKDYGIKQVKSVKKNKSSIPYVSDIFSKAAKMAKNDILMYVNADMIFTRDLISSIRKVISQHMSYLIVGRRINLKLKKIVEFSSPEEILYLHAQAKDFGVLFDHTGIDYFIFNKNLFGDMPNMSIARNRWDNWMCAEGKIRSGVLVDATSSITAIHQNHDYSNVDKRVGRKTIKYQQETQKNIRLTDGQFASILDANYKLTKNGLANIPAWKTNLKKRASFMYRVLDRKLNKVFGFGFSPKQTEVY